LFPKGPQICAGLFVEVRLLKCAHGYKQLRRLDPVDPHSSRHTGGITRSQGKGDSVGQEACGQEASGQSTDRCEDHRSVDAYRSILGAEDRAEERTGKVRIHGESSSHGCLPDCVKLVSR
jgi:hypothetical protein